jgi:hypothetical protein
MSLTWQQAKLLQAPAHPEAETFDGSEWQVSQRVEQLGDELVVNLSRQNVDDASLSEFVRPSNQCAAQEQGLCFSDWLPAAGGIRALLLRRCRLPVLVLLVRLAPGLQLDLRRRRAGHVRTPSSAQHSPRTQLRSSGIRPVLPPERRMVVLSTGVSLFTHARERALVCIHARFQTRLAHANTLTHMSIPCTRTGVNEPHTCPSCNTLF